MKVSVPVTQTVYGDIIIDIPDNEFEGKTQIQQKKMVTDKAKEMIANWEDGRAADPINWSGWGDISVGFGFWRCY